MNKKFDALVATLEAKNMVKCTVIHVDHGKDSPREVATINFPKSMSESDMLEKSFMYTNSIDKSWYSDDKVLYIGPEKSCRSTMTGDMVLIGKKKFKCEATGWSEI